MVPGADGQRWGKGRVSGGVTGGGAGSPLASAVTVFRKPRGTPQEEPGHCGARWSQHRAHCPPSPTPESEPKLRKASEFQGLNFVGGFCCQQLQKTSFRRWVLFPRTRH